MGRGRKSLIEKQGQLSVQEVKDLLLDMVIDEKGNRHSLREIFSNKTFMELSGFWRRNNRGEKTMISPGSISYNIGKLNLTEEYIFKYHKYKTKRIPSSIEQKEWSMRHNKGKSKIVPVKLENYDKKEAIEILNSLFHYAEYDAWLTVNDAWKYINSVVDLFCSLRYCNIKDFYDDFRVVRKCLLKN